MYSKVQNFQVFEWNDKNQRNIRVNLVSKWPTPTNGVEPNKFKEDEIYKVSQYYAKNNLIMKTENQKESLLLNNEDKNLKFPDIEI